MAQREGSSPWTNVVLWLSIVGALNWGLVGFFNWDLVRAIFGNDSATPASGIARIVYAIVGLSGLALAILSPRLRARELPRGATLSDRAEART